MKGSDGLLEFEGDESADAALGGDGALHENEVRAAGGPFGVTYSVTAVRSTLRGNPGVFTLTIGAGTSASELTAGSGDEGENQMKMAA